LSQPNVPASQKKENNASEEPKVRMGFAGSMGEIESVFFREIFLWAAIQDVRVVGLKML
jgi:hypothetical protein